MEERFSYQAYLIRGWQEEGTGWRFRLQDVRTEEQIGFTSVKAMLTYLRDVFEEEGCDGVEEEAR